MFRESAHKVARLLGADFYKLSNAPRPILSGNATVSGSFPPINANQIGRRENYFIHDGYSHRENNDYFDDTGNSDQWQLEVYKFAREICERDRLSTVCDIGCGSAYKLLRYLGDMKTIGVDVPKTIAHLRQRYPDKEWQADFDAVPPFQIDMVIASDVIEHLPDPNGLLSYITGINPKKIVLSTPDRNLLRLGTFNGPPHNTAHVREWSFAEFRAYIDSFFEVEAHFISFAAQATQCVLCRPRQV
jgi:SAM-dependent methyltransferase